MPASRLILLGRANELRREDVLYRTGRGGEEEPRQGVVR